MYPPYGDPTGDNPSTETAKGAKKDILSPFIGPQPATPENIQAISKLIIEAARCAGIDPASLSMQTPPLEGTIPEPVDPDATAEFRDYSQPEQAEKALISKRKPDENVLDPDLLVDPIDQFNIVKQFFRGSFTEDEWKTAEQTRPETSTEGCPESFGWVLVPHLKEGFESTILALEKMWKSTRRATPSIILKTIKSILSYYKDSEKLEAVKQKHNPGLHWVKMDLDDRRPVRKSLSPEKDYCGYLAAECNHLDLFTRNIREFFIAQASMPATLYGGPMDDDD